MGTPDGRYWIVLNGEIYNYVELRDELQALGREFKSHSDTEVLLAAYQEWGKDALNRLVGMFAFAILDAQERRLFLARDFFGIKPLYYAFWQEGLAFSSEIKPLLSLPGIARDVNQQRLYEYLRWSIAHYGDQTMFGEIKQVPAAHSMELALDAPSRASPTQYWNINLNQRAELSFEAAAKQLRELFIESVRMHLRSDVPVGAALSGGIDSSSIVSVMRLLDPKLEIHTFSYIADDPTISEERWVDMLGNDMRVEVHKVRPCPKDLLGDMHALVETQEEPFGSTSMYAQWRVFQAAKETGIKVMLDGQGADELLAGYPSYIGARTDSLVREGRWTDALQLARYGQVSKMWVTLLGAIVRMASSGVQRPLRYLTNKHAIPSWLDSTWFKEKGIASYPTGRLKGSEILKQALVMSLTETTLPQLLHYEDSNSMAFSIESRVPFLTPALVSFVLTLPEDYLLTSKGTTKAVFRKEMRGIVPDAILDRTDKKGFPTPEKYWLLSIRPFVEQILTSQTATQINALNLKEIMNQWEQIVSGSRQMDSCVWRWVNLILWAERFAVNTG
jgi:asparagine synthase (glutamine-hydrolysing)